MPRPQSSSFCASCVANKETRRRGPEPARPPLGNQLSPRILDEPSQEIDCLLLAVKIPNASDDAAFLMQGPAMPQGGRSRHTLRRTPDDNRVRSWRSSTSP